MYLTHYADQCQDLALLSINSFQKDLYDKNQLVLALATSVPRSLAPCHQLQNYETLMAFGTESLYDSMIAEPGQAMGCQG